MFMDDKMKSAPQVKLAINCTISLLNTPFNSFAALQMFDWIYHNREAFGTNYVAIGHSFQESKKLQDEHNHFTMGSNNVFSNINRILADAAKLIEGGHYASGHVRQVAARLDQTWKDFAGCLDERTTVLALSVLFHQKAEQYVENVGKWNQGCETPANPSGGAAGSDIAGLESAIHHHQSLYENMCQAYTEVHSTSKKLLYQLDHLVQMCSQTSAAGDDPRAKHVSSTDKTLDYLYFCLNLSFQVLFILCTERGGKIDSLSIVLSHSVLHGTSNFSNLFHPY